MVTLQSNHDCKLHAYFDWCGCNTSGKEPGIDVQGLGRSVTLVSISGSCCSSCLLTRMPSLVLLLPPSLMLLLPLTILMCCKQGKLHGTCCRAGSAVRLAASNRHDLTAALTNRRQCLQTKCEVFRHFKPFLAFVICMTRCKCFCISLELWHPYFVFALQHWPTVSSAHRQNAVSVQKEEFRESYT